MSKLEHINPSLGTTMFNFYGILSTLNKLNKIIEDSNSETYIPWSL